MNTLIINPGTGPVADATEAEAQKNIEAFVASLGRKGAKAFRIADEDYGEGRFAFRLWDGVREHVVQMPGLPLEKVQYAGKEGQDIWDYPRLYVDGSSWVWCYALSVLDEDEKWEVDNAKD